MPRRAKPIGEQPYNGNPELNAQGFRPVDVWVPDPDAPGFAEEMRRQSLLAAQSEGEREILDWIEAAYDWPKD